MPATTDILYQPPQTSAYASMREAAARTTSAGKPAAAHSLLENASLQEQIEALHHEVLRWKSAAQVFLPPSFSPSPHPCLLSILLGFSLPRTLSLL